MTEVLKLKPLTFQCQARVDQILYLKFQSYFSNHDLFSCFLYGIFREKGEQKEDKIFVRGIHGGSSAAAGTQKKTRILGWGSLGCTYV